MFGRTLKCNIAKDNGRTTEFIRRKEYKDKSKCYECGVCLIFGFFIVWVFRSWEVLLVLFHVFYMHFISERLYLYCLYRISFRPLLRPLLFPVNTSSKSLTITLNTITNIDFCVVHSEELSKNNWLRLWNSRLNEFSILWHDVTSSMIDTI